jgi:hypothetical protein
MEIISRKYAIENNLRHYITGIPCKHGHLMERTTSNRRCIGCHRMRVLEYQKKYKEKHNLVCKVYRDKNPEKVKNTNLNWRSNNADKDNITKREWRISNIDKTNAITAKRRSSKLQRTPQWADLDKIKTFYKESVRLTKETNIKYVVDHIIPLQGELVSGLHVENNLQVITDTENCKKSNTFNIT